LKKPLPTTPFEPVKIETARVNKYAQVHCCGEVYSVPSAQIGERVLLKLWWDRVEIFSRNEERLATLPRCYTLKTQPIDWKGYFRIFCICQPKNGPYINRKLCQL